MSAELTNLDIFVLAMANVAAESEERGFFEWDVIVEAWKIDPNRNGLRGYEDLYPDSKKIALNYMGKGNNTALGKGFAEKVGTNKYRITRLGLSRAAVLRGESIEEATRAWGPENFELLWNAKISSAFTYFEKNLAVHPSWSTTASLLKARKGRPQDSNGHIHRLICEIEGALVAIAKGEVDRIVRSSGDTHKEIDVNDLLLLLKCIHASIMFRKSDLEILHIDIEKHLAELQNAIASYIEASDGTEIDSGTFFSIN